MLYGFCNEYDLATSANCLCFVSKPNFRFLQTIIKGIEKDKKKNIIYVCLTGVLPRLYFVHLPKISF